jgi:hypothetical protein
MNSLESDRLWLEEREGRRTAASSPETERLDKERRTRLAALPQNKTLVSLTRDEYETGRRRRFGTANPEVQDIPFCNAMIEARVGPWYVPNTLMRSPLLRASLPYLTKPPHKY